MLTSPHSLKSEVHNLFSAKKNTCFPQNSHTTKSLYQTLKINRKSPKHTHTHPPTNLNAIGLKPLWNGFSEFHVCWQWARKMSPYQIHLMALYLGLELRGVREWAVMVQTGIAGRNRCPPDWHNQWTLCWKACCNQRW